MTNIGIPTLVSAAVSLLATSSAALGDTVNKLFPDREALLRGYEENRKKPSYVRPAELLILHWNDVHARVVSQNSHGSTCTDKDTANCSGGWAKIGGMIETLCEYQECLLLDAGDEFSGSMFSTAYKGKEAAEFLELIEPDAFVLGNHEWDYGPQVLQENFLDNVHHTPVLSANLDYQLEPALKPGSIDPFTIVYKQGITIGIVGISTPDTIESSSPGDNVFFNDPAKVLQYYTDLLRQKYKVDLVIALTHIGYDKDIELASQVRGVDLFVGGHSHTLLLPSQYEDYDEAQGPYPTMVQDKDGKYRPVVTAKCYSLYAGAILVHFDLKRRVVVKLDPKVFPLTNNPAAGTPPYFPDSELVTDLVDALGGELKYLEEQIVAITLVDLPYDQARKGECLLGSFVAESMVYAVSAITGIVADVGLISGGSIRIPIPKGDISMGDVSAMLPFDNIVEVIKVTGADIVAALENGVSSDEEWPGRFPQVYNIRYTFCLSFPAYSRVQSAYVISSDGTELDIMSDYATTTFLLSTTSYLTGGGDGYSVFVGKEKVLEEGPGDFEAFQLWLEAHSPIGGELDGRIQKVCAKEAFVIES